MDRQPLAILVVNGENRMATISAQLRASGFRLLTARSVVEANRQLDQTLPDLALVALHLPDGEGLSLLSHPALESTRSVILIADEDDPDQVRRGFLAGADFFFCHPAEERYLAALFGDLAAEYTNDHVTPLQGDQPTLESFALLRGSSPVMHRLYRILRKAASSQAGVFLVGEPGTGKNLVAQSLHSLSPRASGPFASLNCGASNGDKLEKELFGQEIINGGTEVRAGCLERADGGTLFLDEITRMPEDLQLQLLRVLETGRFCRVGGRREQTTDLRIVASSARDPEAAIKEGDLRQDLYYRIAGLCVHVPPLRLRGNDIRGLAEHFLALFNEEAGTAKRLTPDSAALLDSYGWPGNVRELRSMMQQAFIMADEEITPEYLPSLHTATAAGGDVLQLNIGDSVQDAEKKLTLATLSFYKGDKRKAAHTLGVSLKTLYNRINAYQAPTADHKKRASAE
ncbi:sigma-54-dependent transcriptional regulator [Gilvimarinus sp. F26214L]|uniref:sigma-54-dependent transcriptional regulator n=1 Tax=Gilvimarinus sp. DZF01 TaxID=3461371 RepID=UPI0040455B6E